MLFKRKKPRPLGKKIRNYIWPSMGWSRFFTYVKRRVVRLSDTPHRIALGLAFGVAASFNPYVGTHIMLACALSYFFGANYIAAALGTIIGNPSTFPFFWWLAIIVGNTILGWFGMEFTDQVSHHTDFTTLLQTAIDEPFNILLPWTVGGYLVGAVMLPISYFIFFPLVNAAKLARAKLLALKKKKLQS